MRPVNPLAVVVEDESSWVIATYLDSTGQPFTPTTVQYRIDQVESGTQILDWTSVTPTAGTQTFTVTPDQNSMISATARQETHQMIVQITDSQIPPNTRNLWVQWWVRRLVGLSTPIT